MAAAVAVLGVPVGLLWSAVAPRADLVPTATGLDYANSETKDFITADALMFLLCVAAGLGAGALAWRFARSRGLLTLLGLAVGAGAGALLAWRTGLHGATRAQVLAAARAGRLTGRVDLPLVLHARTVLLAWPGAACLVWALQVLRSPLPPPAEPPAGPDAVSSG